MSKAATKFLPLLHQFIDNARIQSKEVPPENDERGGSILRLWKSQKMYLDNLIDGLEQGIRTFYVVKSRQLGSTTVNLLIALFWLAVHPNCIGCIVADNDANAAVFRATLKTYLKGFPKGFFGKSFSVAKGGDNKHFMQFTNGSRLDFLVAGSRKKNWGESRGFTFALLSEVSKYGQAEGLANFRETLAETHPDRLFIYESTANGYNFWRDMWIEAGRDTLTKRRIFIGWWAKELNSISKADPRFEIYGTGAPDQRERELMKIVAHRYGVIITPQQLAWKRWKDSDESVNANDSAQNQPWIDEEAFVQSGFSFFQIRSVQQDIDELYRIAEQRGREFQTNETLLTPEQRRRAAFQGFKYLIGNDFWAIKMEEILDMARIGEVELKIWEQPKKGGLYVIGGDPAYGRSEWADRHAFSVFRCYADRLVQVAEYASADYETRQAAWVLAHIAGAYRDCYVNLELTGPGRVVAVEFDNLRERLRAEMYSKVTEDREWDDVLSTARWYLYHRWDSSGGGYAKGFETTWRTKMEIMNQLRDSYTARLLDISSVSLLEEMCIVTQEGNDISAKGRGKDDRVFAAALANRAWIDWVRPSMVAQGLSYRRVTEEELGERSSAATYLDRVVERWFMRREEMDQAPPHAPQWLIDRGFA